MTQGFRQIYKSVLANFSPLSNQPFALDAAVETIKGALKAGDTVNLIGFGTFYVGERAARTGRNPRTGKTLQIKAAKSPKFRAGKGLKDACN